ncbi:MAG: hypothetical protein GY757_36525 [bacterium]|nr:hypothetical protein [bacterium]
METIIKLNIWITKLVEKIGKKTVLMIDEVDKNCNNQLFLANGANATAMALYNRSHRTTETELKQSVN